MVKRAKHITNDSTHLKFENIYFLIGAISLILVLWQHWGMNRLVVLYPSDAEVTVKDDILNGGLSKSALTITPKGAELTCEIILSSTFPFCTLDIAVGDGANQGLDFSQFDHLNLWLDHSSTAQDTVIVYLVNREQVSDDLDPSSRNTNNKSNQHIILPTSGKGDYQMPVSQFTVPSWWILLHKAAGQAAKPSVNNVISLSIATGDSYATRHVNILLERATVTGKWIAANTLYLVLAIIWAITITLNAGVRVYQLVNQLQLKKRQNDSLAELNHFLSIQKDEFEVLAKTDPLTGIANRAGTRDLFEEMQSQSERKFSLIMFDIDNFKSVNDTHGHQVGDNILKHLSRFVAAAIREADHLARWGGEEFIVICPDTSLVEAVEMANHLKQKIALTSLSDGLSITCSFGVSEYQPLGKNSIQRMFEAADLAMYKAKEGGRNRVEH